MNTSPNSKMPPLNTSLDTQKFEKYGLDFTLNVKTETRPKWIQVCKDRSGRKYTEEEIRWLSEVVQECRRTNQPVEELPQFILAWELTEEKVSCTYVVSATLQDDEDCKTPKPVELFSTPDGPILGIVEFSAEEEMYCLLDPCVVQYVNDQIKLIPIFNVARRLRLKKNAVRAIQAPAELIIACYPDFVMQNRMMEHQLRPEVPFSVSPKLTSNSIKKDSD